MKTNSIFLGVMMLAMPALSYAQKGIKDGSKYGHGEDSIRCIQNLDMMQQYTKQKDYASASICFEIVYSECPKCSKSVYTNGAEILANSIKNEKDQAKKDQIFDRLMKLYDDRIKYFGKDKKYDKYYILGKKANDYIQYSSDEKDPEKKEAYKWLGEIIENKGAQTPARILQQRFYLANNMYKKDNAGFRDSYLSDYLKVTELLNDMIANMDTTNADYKGYEKAKADIDQKFAASGAADCNTLEGVYASKIEANKNDKDFLNTVLALFEMAKCQKSSVYFKAAAYKHKIEPSAKSARGLAQQSINNKDYNKALTYLNDAINYETKASEKSQLQYNIAEIYYSNMKNPTAARAAAQKAIALDKSNGNAYILIGLIYASYNSDISDDAVIRKTAYWAAVDQWEKAKSMCPSVAAEANKYINKYKQFFPAANELFMRNITKGQTYTVPGWINEKTTVRFE